MDAERGTQSIFARGTQYLTESAEELKKVSSPTRQETIQATLVTLFIIVVVSLYLFFVDLACNGIMASVITSQGQ